MTTTTARVFEDIDGERYFEIAPDRFVCHETMAQAVEFAAFMPRAVMTFDALSAAVPFSGLFPVKD